MTKVTIYRVEDPDGAGPYQRYIGLWTRRSHSDITGHPGPLHDDGIKAWLSLSPDQDYDFLVELVKPYTFGFGSMRQLADWFDHEELAKLYKLGYKVVTYTIDIAHVVAGSKQVLFKRNVAEPCASVDVYWENYNNKCA